MDAFLVFLTAFGFILLAELGDKSQILAATLALRNSRLPVLLGVLAGLALATVVGVVLGVVFKLFIPVFWLNVGGAAVFFVFGFWTVLSKDEGCCDGKEAAASGKSVFATSLGLTFAAESGDKTQLVVIALVATLGSPVSVFAGAFLGFAVLSTVAVFVGCAIGKRVSERKLKLASGVLFLATGVVMLFGLVFGIL